MLVLCHSVRVERLDSKATLTEYKLWLTLLTFEQIIWSLIAFITYVPKENNEIIYVIDEWKD